MQSFPYENHCKCYKKLESRLWPVLFTVIYFPLIFFSFSAVKQKVVIAVFLSEIHHRPVYNDIYYETILVWGLISILLTNPTHCL